MQPVATVEIPPPQPPLYRRRWVRVLGGTALSLLLIALLAPAAYVAWWRAHTPAPLGRSARAVDSALAQALPAGTPRDSAAAFFARQGVPFSVDSGPAGLAMVGITGDVNTDGLVSTRVEIRLAFDSAGRLTTRATKGWYTGP